MSQLKAFLNLTHAVLEPGEMAEYLIQVPDKVWGIYALNRDPLCGRIDKTLAEKLISQALDCGKELAGHYISLCKTNSPDQIAEYLHVKVKKPQIPEEGGRILFARFTEPDIIEVFSDALEKVTRLGCFPSFPKNGGEWEDILTAHELFHVVELRHEDEIFTRKKHITIFSIGSIQYRATVNALSEIAAMSFAREICGLAYLPFALDVMLTYGYQAEAAGELFYEIRDIYETYKNEMDHNGRT